MKKFVAGIVVGAIISTAGTAFAAGTLVGKKVDGEIQITLNGKNVSNGVIIAGTSYAPVRSITETVGLDVSYSKGVVKLESGTTNEEVDPYAFYNTAEKINERIARLEENITRNEKVISDQQYAIDVRTKYLNENPNSSDKESIETEIEGRKRTIATAQSNIDNNKREIEELKDKLSKL
ncbi:hypothetical protein BBD42_30835 [Paenibacillus sp. BIHB 4019]|uniref:Copper amine oxidase-like N-terminal domain-containing protein n=1 Tax=Paenibacillus sp. BIHB 4019 TaxID=1870819 RepID=A0A1B2DRQ8_9BACL|nr:hypothetical protein [Paenibacillus sp. BIHB 4019]ANY70404.1 hypothetical protein BBD42_30835 [Paenibacillus sp. BIHB 4019]